MGFALGAVLVAALAWFLVARHGELSSIKDVTFTQLTDAPGQELYPSLSPDGKSFVYQSREAGNWDIFFQRVGGNATINLTKDSPEDDTAPAFSPDGEQIAFRSERAGGGIFLMGATGESIRRLTDFGFNPAWSPDGKEIVCATASFVDPDSLSTRAGQLFIVNVATGQKRLIAEAQDAHQPQWSPNGHRIAYWGRPPGALQRDIWTVPSGGGAPVRITNDAATDWNPVWSADGLYLYFASNRTGSMNLCRARVEEASGKVAGPSEAITTPAAYAGWFSISRLGGRIAYAQRTVSANLYKVAFDPEKETVTGKPVAIEQGSRDIGGAVVSPDNLSVAFVFLGAQEDIAVIRSDGTGLRKLTDDPYKDRKPSWSPNGKEITFHSDRSGKFEIWTIRPDGSDLRQITNLGLSPTGGAWSPDSSRLAVRIPQQVGSPARVAVVDMRKPGQTPETLPLLTPPGVLSFRPGVVVPRRTPACAQSGGP